MNKQTNKGPSDKALKDFLKGTSPAGDDFEKDAREGFSRLESDQQALDAKRALDKKIQASGIFEDQQKKETNLKNSKNTNRYWMAAAGFLLVVGLSVYFVGNSPIKEKDLAITHTEALPEAQQIMFDSVSPDQDKSAVAPSENKAKVPLAERSAKQNRLTTKSPENATSESLKRADDEDVENKDIVSSATQENALSEGELSPVKKEAEMATEPAKSAPEVSAQKMSVAKKSGAKSDRKKALPIQADSSFAMSSGALFSQNAPATPVAGKDDRPAQKVYYKNGEQALQKELKEKLLKINCDQKFDALLAIDKKGKVNQASVTAAYGLSKARQKKIIGILESLEGFIVNPLPEGNTAVDYKLNYR